MKTIERLNKYLQIRKIRITAFERRCKVANGYFGKQLKKKASIGSDILEKVAVAYPDLNLVWLITGKGSMITSAPKTTKEDQQANFILEEEQARYERTVRIVGSAKKLLKEITSLEVEGKEKKNRKKKG